MSEASDAFDRAAEKEARTREAYQGEDPVRIARATSLAGFVFFAITLAAHWLAVQRMTGWMIGHIIFVGMCAAGAVQQWVAGDSSRDSASNEG